MTSNEIVLAGLAVALILSGVDLLDSHGHSLLAWAVLVLSLVLIFSNL